MGAGAPYGLIAPAALPASSWWGSKYLAISAEVLFGLDRDQTVTIQNHPSHLPLEERKRLSGLTATDRVGNSIWIFLLRGD